MRLQVHDELVFDIYKSQLKELKTVSKTEIENAYTLEVPLDVELDIGLNWLGRIRNIYKDKTKLIKWTE
jgi:DNA polymerase-1